MIYELEKAHAVSGNERSVGEVIKNEIEKYCADVYYDKMGNLHAIKKGGKSHISLICHMDEPGIIVTKITDDGYLKFETVGRIKPEFLVSKRININGMIGIISLKAVHLTTKEERKVPVKSRQLFIDIGAASKEEAAEYIMPGDYGTLCTEFNEFGNCIKGRALGGRLGCAAAAELLKDDMIENIHVIFAVQREVNCRGMIAAAGNHTVKYAVVIDGAEATSPGTENKPFCGGGPVIMIQTGDTVCDGRLVSSAAQIAEKNNIKYQTALSKEIWQSNILMKNGNNTGCLCLGLPIKYPQSAVQAASKEDAKELYRLLKMILIGGAIHE